MSEAPTRSKRSTPLIRDLAAASAAVLLVVAAVLVAGHLYRSGTPVRAGWPPLYATWLPHVGPGTPVALLIAVGVVCWGPALAARMRWRPLLFASYLAAVAWTLALAMVDGWRRGLADRLTDRPEYLTEVPGVTDIPAMLRGFDARILDFQPDSWTIHVSGHPPGALLVFVWLDRIGLGGGGWAAIAVVAVGATAAVSVPVAVRALGDEAAARAAIPFLVLFPGAVWVGASADGLFTGVTAAGVALLAVGCARRGPGSAVAGFTGGVLLGFACYLSYGLVLIAPIAAAVVLSTRRSGPPGWGLAGALAVVGVFTVAGFWWLDGYHLVVERYYQGIAADRPYRYWVWANLACVVLSAGPAVAPALQRAATRVIGEGRSVVAALALGAVVAIVCADLSGLSKAEVERIWLPFAVWLVAACALLPPGGRRPWLAVQAATALAVNHFVLTSW